MPVRRELTACDLQSRTFPALATATMPIPEDGRRPGELTVAIVLFRPDLAILEATIRSLRGSVDGISLRGEASLSLVDHSPGAEGRRSADLARRAGDWFGAPVAVVPDPSNPGFGSGHNRMLDRVGEYHLVLNPDVELARDALAAALAFMRAHPDCGLLAPASFGPDGARQFLCKRYPTVLDLLLRGFAPKPVKRLFRARLDRYEMRDLVGDAVVWDPPIVSGCFMIFRGDVFRRLEGFDPRFFLYFEDFDISLRAASIARIAYVPSVRIVHHGGHAARKGLRHVRMFAASAFRFFSKHGWAWF